VAVSGEIEGVGEDLAGVPELARDAFLLDLEQVEWDGAGVVGVEQFLSLRSSNRSSSVSYPAASDSSGAVTTSHTYDAADRLLPSGVDTGVTYDSYGRTTSLPAGETNNNTALSVDYYNTHLVHSQDAGQHHRVLDPRRHRTTRRTHLAYPAATCTGTPTAATTNQYDNAGTDSPEWIAETSDASQWTDRRRHLPVREPARRHCRDRRRRSASTQYRPGLRRVRQQLRRDEPLRRARRPATRRR
jgi:hypothetical protein